MKKLILLSILLIVGCEKDSPTEPSYTSCKWINYYSGALNTGAGAWNIYKEYCIGEDIGCSANPVIGDSEDVTIVEVNSVEHIWVYYAKKIHLYKDEKRAEITTTNEGIKTIDLDGVTYTYDIP